MTSIVPQGIKVGPRKGQPLSVSYLKGWVTALVDLWQVRFPEEAWLIFVQQDVDKEYDPNKPVPPSPRGRFINLYIEEYKSSHFDTSGGQMAIREKNHLLKVYSPHQLADMAGGLLTTGTEMDLRTRLDLLMGHFMLLRSHNRLDAQLADFYFRPQYQEGIRGDQNLLLLLLRKGKVRSSYTLNSANWVIDTRGMAGTPCWRISAQRCYCLLGQCSGVLPLVSVRCQKGIAASGFCRF
jgi:hypothetical protein